LTPASLYMLLAFTTAGMPATVVTDCAAVAMEVMHVPARATPTHAAIRKKRGGRGVMAIFVIDK
jgi:hypothetical protein